MYHSSLGTLTLLIALSLPSVRVAITEMATPIPTPIPACTGKALDVFFLVQESHSFTNGEVKAQLRFVKDVVSSYYLTTTRVSVATFGGADRSQMTLGNNTDELFTSIKDFRKRGGVANTHIALRSMITKSRDGRSENRTQVAVVMTNGNADNRNETRDAAEDARDVGITMFAVALNFFQIEGFISKAGLKDIATDKDHVYVKTYNRTAKLPLQNFDEELAYKTCTTD